MSRWHNHYIDGMIHFCTATVQDWQPRLDDDAAALLYKEWELARRALNVGLLAYVVMPDHIHQLLWSEKARWVREFGQRTLSRSSKRIGKGGKFWKERLRVVPLYSNSVIKTKLDYIHNNPPKRGLAVSADEWRHSSYAQIALGRTLVPFVCDAWPEGVSLRP